MKLSIKECPICKGQLAARYPTPQSFDTTVKYICSTHVQDSKLSHYYIEFNGNNWIQIIHAPPYTIINRSNNDITDVYPYEGVGTGHITDRKKIISFPRLPLTPTLAERIKMLIVFS